MDSTVTDIWFRTTLPLDEIARQLMLRDITEDAENDWAWAIGTLGSTQLDITRTHGLPAGTVDTRIFILGEANEFPDSLIVELVNRLRRFVSGPLKTGRWQYRSGNDFDLVLVQEYQPTTETP